MSEEPYSPREIAQLFKAAHERDNDFHDKLMNRMDDFEVTTTDALKRIETQTVKTNGRVSKLENWQAYVIGFCACVSLVLLPLLLILAKAYFKA